MADEKTLKETLFYTKKTVYELAEEEQIQAAYDYAEGYKKFLDAAKTERESVTESIKLAEAAGFKPYAFGDAVKAGDRLYYNNRGKNLFLFTVGSAPINEGIRISAAHVDSPRIDLKQCPLYEDSGMGFLRTHYYGGIRKYQWPTTPLALHGVVVRADGSSVNVVIGEDDNDPIFYINDLLPHLAGGQNGQTLGSAFSGEKLNVLAGSRPYSKEGGEGIKLNVMRLLNEKYNITEEDFLSAELCVVPAAKARDVGLDRALIGAYGHDDRVCAYPALSAILEEEAPVHTLMCILADKEESGSDGVGGMQCELILDLINELSVALGGNPAVVRANS